MNPRRPPWQGGTLPLSYSRNGEARPFLARLRRLPRGFVTYARQFDIWWHATSWDHRPIPRFLPPTRDIRRRPDRSPTRLPPGRAAFVGPAPPPPPARLRPARALLALLAVVSTPFSAPFPLRPLPAPPPSRSAPFPLRPLPAPSPSRSLPFPLPPGPPHCRLSATPYPGLAPAVHTEPEGQRSSTSSLSRTRDAPAAFLLSCG